MSFARRLLPLLPLAGLVLLLQAQSNTDVQSHITRGEYSTTADTAYFVDPANGRDSRDCTSATRPCKTMAGVCAKFPPHVWHDLTVNMDGGAYSSLCMLDGIRVETGPSRIAPGSITFTSSLQAASLSAGAGSGVATSADTSSITYGGGWDDGGIVGLAVEIQQGTGAGQIREISANTCCALTVGTVFATAPDSTSGFRIDDWAAVVTGNQQQLWTTGWGSTTGNAAAALVNVGSGLIDSAASKPAVTFHGIKFGVGVDAGVAITSGSVAMHLVSFSGSGGPPVELLGPTANVTATRAVGYSATYANRATATIDFPAILAGATNDQTVVAAAFSPGLPLSCSYPPALSASAVPTCFSTDAGTVTWRLLNANMDGGTIDPASGSFGAARPW